jgi:hypothetical protein
MSSAAQDRRIADLERELAVSRAEVARLKFQLDVQPRGNVHEEIDLPAAMPSEHQLRRLFDIVTTKYPTLSRVGGRTDVEHYDAYAGSFLALQFIRRIPTLDCSRSNGSWCGLVESWLRDRGRGVSIHSAAFSAAVVACHDISFTTQDRFQSMFGLGFGLCFAGASVNSRPPTAAWQRLLNGSELPREPEHGRGLTLRPDLTGAVRVGGVGITK